jgi:hypothetical protein
MYYDIFFVNKYFAYGVIFSEWLDRELPGDVPRLML